MSQSSLSSHPITVIGLSARGAEDLSPRQLAAIARADVLAGGRRHLAYFPDFVGERLPIASNLDPLLVRIREAHAAGRRIVVLASGDPLFYGIGKRLVATFPPEALHFEPSPTAIQLAFAALKEPWEDAVLLSAHAGELAPLIPRILAAPKAAILTNRTSHAPDVIARELLAAGLSPETRAAVCENLGGSDERVVRATLGEVAASQFAPLNVLVVWPGPRAARHEPGLPDEAFATHNQLITKREVRLLALAELALGPGQVLWDIGAGSGAVGIEAARMQSAGQVYAVEKRAGLVPIIQENLRRFPAPNYHFSQGSAPDMLGQWPDPDAVFIGGSGGRMFEIIEVVKRRLRPGGRIVVNLATIESVPPVMALLPDARLLHIQISRGIPLLDKTRLQPLNPVFMIIWKATH